MAGDRPQCRQYREPFRGRSGVLFRKAGGRADTRTRLYTKKGCGPGLGAGCIFSALRPLQLRGPRAPLLYGRRFFNSAGEVLLKREPTGSPGVRGTPGAFLHPFVTGDKPLYPSFSGLACGPPSFFARRKKAKTCRGHRPLDPRVVCRLSLEESRRWHGCLNQR